MTTDVSGAAYRRLGVDERRAQLLEVGTELFTEHSYEELSMARVAKEAGISKALLYHYFPSKDEFFKAAIAEAAAELAQRTAPDESLPPLEQVHASTRAFVDWIAERGAAYMKLLQSVGAVPELRETMTGIRDFTSARILDGLVPEPERTPAKRAAVRAWLWFMDGILLDWIEHGDRDADAVADQLAGSLTALLDAA
jgi:AcrR family transcriptional regulator